MASKSRNLSSYSRTDRAMGIRTARAESQRRLKVDHPHQAYAEDYQPTPGTVIDDILCALPFRPEQTVFIDLGAGKGRALCLAAAYPFKRIVGVELIPSLVDDCRQNLASLSGPWIRCAEVSCIQGDAATYRFPSEPMVVYLYNPFRAPVLRLVQRNLHKSVASTPRPVWLAYYMPVQRHHFDRDPAFESVDEARDWVTYRVSSGTGN